jgi:hypothetical protein
MYTTATAATIPITKPAMPPPSISAPSLAPLHTAPPCRPMHAPPVRTHTP